MARYGTVSSRARPRSNDGHCGVSLVDDPTADQPVVATMLALSIRRNRRSRRRGRELCDAGRRPADAEARRHRPADATTALASTAIIGAQRRMPSSECVAVERRSHRVCARFERAEHGLSGRLLSSMSSDSKNSCNDQPLAAAARDAKSLRTSSGTLRMVMATGMPAI